MLYLVYGCSLFCVCVWGDVVGGLCFCVGCFVLLLCGVWDLVLVFLVAASQLPMYFFFLAILRTIAV